MNTKTTWAKAGLLGAMLLGAAPMWAQETTPARTSTLASIKLPAGAARVSTGSVPKEVTDALSTMMKAGGDGVKRGKTEVIAWIGGGYSLKQVPRLKKSVASAFKGAGWTYEEGEPLPEAEGFTMVSALKTAPTKKALIGFWAPGKDALLLAWTEMLPANPAPAAADQPVDEPAAEEPAAEEPAAAEEPVVDEILPLEEDAEAPAADEAPAGDEAEGEGPTSKVASITLPESPAAVPGAASAFTNLLKAVGDEKKVDMRPATEGAKAEVWKWTRQADAAEIRDSVQAALKERGYIVLDYKQGKLPQYDLSKYFAGAQLPFRPAKGVQPSIFVAPNPKLPIDAFNHMIMGVWIQGENGLALGLLPVKFKPVQR